MMARSVFFVTTMLSLSLAACQSRSIKMSSPTPASESIGEESQTSAKDQNPGQPPSDTLSAEDIHYIIVPGWGQHFAPILSYRYKDYMQWFIDAGVRPDHVHVTRYSYLKDMPSIEAEIDEQFRSIIAKASPTARFDIIGHSMGGFVGLYTAMRHDYYIRFRRFISLAGIPFGWDSRPCGIGLCGKALRLLIPFKSPFVMQFHAEYADRIRGLQTCSLYSRADAIIRPFDAGKMPTGQNFEIPDMGHLEIIGKKEYFDVLKAKCYGGKMS